MNTKCFHLFLACLLLLLAACASMGNPDGGPFDETPPKLVSSNPVEKAINSRSRKVELVFDEIVKVENASEKVIVSPPQLEQPEIKTSGRRIIVELQDTLKSNTTYSIDFADAIVDNNEGNPMGNFAFTFSTGEQIDSMEVSGTVLNAQDLEPIKGILVGLYSEVEDSVFRTKPFERVARTNGSGRFVIKGVAPGSYRIYALQDVDQDFKFSQKNERLAFDTLLLTTSSKPDVRLDTLWTDSIHYDSIVPVRYTHYYPDDLVLRAFTEVQTDRFLLKSERPLPHRFGLYFSAPCDTLPLLRGLNFDTKDAFVVQRSTYNDTIQYWIKDSLIIQKDTLDIELTYYMTDSLGQLALQTDTLALAPKKSLERIQKEEQQRIDEWKKEQKKKERKGEPVDSVPPVVPLSVKITPAGGLDPDTWLHLVFEEPLVSVDTSRIHLELKVDTLWQDAPFVLDTVPNRLLELQLVGEWRYGQEYRLKVDSACFQGLYGTVNHPVAQNLTVRKEDDYSTLFLHLQGLEGQPALVELLNQDKPVKRVAVKDNKAEFYFVTPGKYYLRLIIDSNNDGSWTTGEYAEGRQPEEVFYYPGALDLKKQWDITQDWDIRARALDKQKPFEIIQQKPDQVKTVRKRNQERAKAMRDRNRKPGDNNRS